MSVKSYMRNMSRSFGFTFSDSVKQRAYNVVDLSENIKMTSNDINRYYREQTSKINKTSGFLKNGLLKDATGVFKDAVSDLRSGKFVDPYRDSTGDLSDISWDDIDISFEDEEDEEIKERKANTLRNKLMSHENRQNASMISNTMLATTNALMKTNQATTSALMTQNVATYNLLDKGLSNINTTLTQRLANNEALIKQQMDNAVKFYTESLKVQKDIYELLKKSTEMGTADDQLRSEKSPKYGIQSVLSMGSLDKRKYMTNVKNNLASYGFDIDEIFRMKEMLGQLKELQGGNRMVTDPLKFVTKGIISASTPLLVKQITDSVNTIAGDLPKLILNKFNSMAESNNSFASMIGQIFGVDNSLLGVQDRASKYIKGKVAWDGKSKKALEEVIPSYLAEIASALTGKEHKLYDYESGKFKTISKMKKDRMDSLKSISKSAYQSVYEDSDSIINKLFMDDKNITFEGIKKLKSERDKVLQELFASELSFSKDSLKQLKDDNKISDDALALMLKVISSRVSPKNNKDKIRYNLNNIITESTRLDAIDRYNKKMLTRDSTDSYFTGNFFDSIRLKSDKDEIINSFNKELFSSNLPKGNVKSFGSTLAESVLKVTDKNEKTIFDYLRMIEENTSRVSTYKSTASTVRPSGRNITNIRNRRQVSREVQTQSDSEVAPSYEDEYGYSLGSIASRLQNIVPELKGYDIEKEVKSIGPLNIFKKLSNNITNSPLMDVATTNAAVLSGLMSKVLVGDKSGSDKSFVEHLKDIFDDPDSTMGKLLRKTEESMEDANSFKAFIKQSGKTLLEKILKVPIVDKAKNEIKGTGKEMWNITSSAVSSSIKGTMDDISTALGRNETADSKGFGKGEFAAYGTFDKNIPYKDKLKGSLKSELNFRDYVEKNINFASHNAFGSGIKLPFKKNKDELADGEGNTINRPMLTYISDGEVVLNKIQAETYRKYMTYAKSDKIKSETYKDILDKIIDKTGFVISDKTKNTAYEYADKAISATGKLKTGVKNVSKETISELGVAASEIGNSLVGINLKNEKGLGKEVTNTFKKTSRKVFASAGLGGLTALLLGTIGGPLAGAAVGAGASLVSDSDKLRKYLFGDMANGEKGLISGSTVATFKKYFPDFKKYGISASLLGLLPMVPFGPVGGLMLGGAISFAKNNEDIRNSLFGSSVNSTKALAFMKKHHKRLITGAVAGAIIGGPFGLIGNMMLGSGVSALTTSDKFKTLLLGTKDKEGNYQDGLFPTIRDHAVLPLVNFAKQIPKNLKDFAESQIFKPLKYAMEPFVQMVKNIGKGANKKFRSFIGNMLNDKLFLPFHKMVEEKIDKFTKKLLSPLYKFATNMAKNIITLPLKPILGISNRIRDKQVKKNTAFNMSAVERATYASMRGIKLNDATNAINQTLMNADAEELSNIEKQLEMLMINSGEKAKEARIGVSKSTDRLRQTSNKLTHSKLKTLKYYLNDPFKMSRPADYKEDYMKSVYQIAYKAKLTSGELKEFVKAASDHYDMVAELYTEDSRLARNTKKELTEIFGIDIFDPDNGNKRDISDILELVQKEKAYHKKVSADKYGVDEKGKPLKEASVNDKLQTSLSKYLDTMPNYHGSILSRLDIIARNLIDKTATKFTGVNYALAPTQTSLYQTDALMHNFSDTNLDIEDIDMARLRMRSGNYSKYNYDKRIRKSIPAKANRIYNIGKSIKTGYKYYLSDPFLYEGSDILYANSLKEAEKKKSEKSKKSDKKASEKKKKSDKKSEVLSDSTKQILNELINPNDSQSIELGSKLSSNTSNNDSKSETKEDAKPKSYVENTKWGIIRHKTNKYGEDEIDNTDADTVETLRRKEKEENAELEYLKSNSNKNDKSSSNKDKSDDDKKKSKGLFSKLFGVASAITGMIGSVIAPLKGLGSKLFGASKGMLGGSAIAGMPRLGGIGTALGLLALAPVLTDKVIPYVEKNWDTQIKPYVEKIIPSVGTFVVKMLPYIGDALVIMAKQIVPILKSMGSGVANLLTGKVSNGDKVYTKDENGNIVATAPAKPSDGYTLRESGDLTSKAVRGVVSPSYLKTPAPIHHTKMAVGKFANTKVGGHLGKVARLPLKSKLVRGTVGIGKALKTAMIDVPAAMVKTPHMLLTGQADKIPAMFSRAIVGESASEYYKRMTGGADSVKKTVKASESSSFVRRTGSKVAEKASSLVKNNNALSALFAVSKGTASNVASALNKASSITVKDGAKAVQSNFIKIFTKLFDNKIAARVLGEGFTARCKDAIGEFAKRFSAQLVAKSTGKGVLKAGLRVGTRSAAMFGTLGLGTILFAVYDAWDGWFNAHKYLNISEDIAREELPMSIKFASMLIKLVTGLGLATSIFPHEWWMKLYMELIAPLFGEDSQKLKELQDKTKDRVAEYNKTHGTKLTLKQYNAKWKEDNTLAGRANKFIIQGITGIYNKAVSKVKSAVSTIGTIAGNVASSVGGFFGISEKDNKFANTLKRNSAALANSNNETAKANNAGSGDDTGVGVSRSVIDSKRKAVSNIPNSGTYFSQKDPKWGNLKLSNSNMAQSGCGPTSIAMALSDLTGNKITPDKVASDNKDYLPGHATWGLFPNVAKQYGLKYNKVSPSKTDLINNIKQGGNVIISGTRSSKYAIGESPFTNAGHIVVAKDVVGDKVKIADPRGPQFNRYYPLSTVLDDMTVGFKYSNGMSNAERINQINKEDYSKYAGADGAETPGMKLGDSVVAYARQIKPKVKYVFGGNSFGPNGISTDCSGFTKYVYKQAANIDLPRTSSEQGKSGTPIDIKDVAPGDLATYSGHVGIFVDKNTIIHNSAPGTNVIESPYKYGSNGAVRPRRVLDPSQVGTGVGGATQSTDGASQSGDGSQSTSSVASSGNPFETFFGSISSAFNLGAAKLFGLDSLIAPETPASGGSTSADGSLSTGSTPSGYTQAAGGQGIHMKLNREDDSTIEELDAYLSYKRGPSRRNIPTGMTGRAIKTAQNNTKIAAADILAFAAIESEWGVSRIANDKQNYFGIGAFDNNPYNGSFTFGNANSREIGFIKGVEWIARNYVYGKYKQDTFWTIFRGPKGDGRVHAYSTDVNEPAKCARIRENFYKWRNARRNGGKGPDGELYDYADSLGGAENDQLLSTAMPESVNGFPYWTQCDARWQKYGKYEYSACGPTSLAMVASAVSKKSVTPVEVGKKAIRKGEWSSGGPSNHTIFKSIGPDYGFTAPPSGSFNSKTEAGIKNRQVTILVGRGRAPFTGGGHYVVALGSVDGNSVAVNDPISKKRSTVYPMSALKGAHNTFPVSVNGSPLLWDGKGVNVSGGSSDQQSESTASASGGENSASSGNPFETFFGSISSAFNLGASKLYGLDAGAESSGGLPSASAAEPPMDATMDSTSGGTSGSSSKSKSKINLDDKIPNRKNLNKAQISLLETEHKRGEKYKSLLGVSSPFDIVKDVASGKAKKPKKSNNPIVSSFARTASLGKGPDTNFKVSSRFGPRNIAGHGEYHTGTDFDTFGKRKPIYSNVSGVVTAVRNTLHDGKVVEIRDSYGNMHSFSHLTNSNVKTGQFVKLKDLIGTTGDSGKSANGIHLHYEITNKNNEAMSPDHYLDKYGSFGGTQKNKISTPDLLGEYMFNPETPIQQQPIQQTSNTSDIIGLIQKVVSLLVNISSTNSITANSMGTIIKILTKYIDKLPPEAKKDLQDVASIHQDMAKLLYQDKFNTLKSQSGKDRVINSDVREVYNILDKLATQ